MKKAQSAMEYLMTYGWAILIIAIVLAALFSLGVFNSNLVGNNCIAVPGFFCSRPILENGNLILSVGQNIGSSMPYSTFFFVNKNEPMPNATSQEAIDSLYEYCIARPSSGFETVEDPFNQKGEPIGANGKKLSFYYETTPPPCESCPSGSSGGLAAQGPSSQNAKSEAADSKKLSFGSMISTSSSSSTCEGFMYAGGVAKGSTSVVNPNFNDGQVLYLTFDLNETPPYFLSTHAGTSASGTIWMIYEIPSGQLLLLEIGTIKATET